MENHEHDPSDLHAFISEIENAARLQEARNRVFWFYVVSVPSLLLVIAGGITRKWAFFLGYPALLAASGAVVDNMELVVPALKEKRRHQIWVGILLGLTSGSLAVLGVTLFVDAIFKPDVRNLLMGLFVFIFSGRASLLSLRMASGQISVDDYAQRMKMRQMMG